MKPTILIIEDDTAARHSLRMVLETYGYRVRDFASSEDFAREPPNPRSFLILDINLPGASGLETLRRLRAAGSSIPAVLVSGRASDALRAEAAHLNALRIFQQGDRYRCPAGGNQVDQTLRLVAIRMCRRKALS